MPFFWQFSDTEKEANLIILITKLFAKYCFTKGLYVTMPWCNTGL